MSQLEDRLEAKLKAASEQYFRSGLSKADAGDLSRAASDLEKAVRYNKYHIRARNLLGLVEFQRGELGEAVKQWSVSEYLDPKQNEASRYLKEIKTEPSLLSDMNESIHLYNEAGELARKGSIDFAITRLKKAVHLNPGFVKAQLMLALCYMEIRYYKTALRVLDQVAKVDPLNPDAMRYRLYIAQQRRDGVQDASLSDIQDLSRDLYVQQALPKPDKNEIFRERRGRRKAVRNMGESMMQVLLFFAGVLCCLGFMLTLWYPQEIRDLKNQVLDLQISQKELREDKEEMQTRIDTAGRLLLRICEGGNTIQAGIQADVEELLQEWGLKTSEDQTEEKK